MSGQTPALATKPGSTDELVELRRLADEAIEKLMNRSPAEGYRLWSDLEKTVREAQHPELQVEADAATGDVAFIDPYTGERTLVAGVDVDVRITSGVEPDQDGTVSLSWDLPSNHDGIVYLSTASGLPVELPTGWEDRS